MLHEIFLLKSKKNFSEIKITPFNYKKNKGQNHKSELKNVLLKLQSINHL